MSDKDRSYRSSQLITPFGPGSIIEIGEESLMLVDPSRWPKNLKEIKLERLAKELGVWKFKKPPFIESGTYSTVKSHNSLMTVRFPAWMFCSRCRKMEKWVPDKERLNNDGLPVCQNNDCKDKVLTPMRFVSACDEGHIQDVDWVWWAHKESKKCDSPELYFKSNPNLGSGLDALFVYCENCNCKNSLQNLLAPNSMKGVRCQNRQPWEFNDEFCSEELKVLQRGASNLYYPIIRSALDIPYSNSSIGNPIYARIKASEDFDDLLNIYEKFKLAGTEEKKAKFEKRLKSFAEDIATEFGLTIDEVIEAISARAPEKRVFKIPRDSDLRVAEWDILSSSEVQSKQTDTFKARISNLSSKDSFGFENILKKVVLLDKLREVRAFCGFERISPSDKVIQPTTSLSDKSWLPATEVYGEGVFIEFDQMKLEYWENSLSTEGHKYLRDFQIRHSSSVSNYLPEPTAKFLVLHTFAHLLIRQLTFECGYSSGSLRERVYANDGQAGILIYTADGDSEGSLGGLVQQGEPQYLFPAMISALETACWCSNDPVCSEMDSQGIMGLNKAACHSCTLISETSCESNNLLLDRNILIADNKFKGFFIDILKSSQVSY